MSRSLNDINEQDLLEIEALAGRLYTPKEIAIIRDFDITLFVEECNTPDTKTFYAFQRGFLLTDYSLRDSIIMLAKAGSVPAQSMAVQMLNNSKAKRNEI